VYGAIIRVMSRGLLDATVLQKIDRLLPPVIPLRELALSLMPDFLSMQFSPESYVPIASVCFQDCTQTLVEVRIALFEYHAHGTYYRDVKEPANESAAVFFERYFLEDAAFRLYSAGEHLANAIRFMLDVRESQLQPYRKKKSSQQSTIAAYLRREATDSALSQAIVELGAAPCWRFTTAYRNRVVHEQPPIVSGLGHSFRRRLRWIVSRDRTKSLLEIGGGDAPEFEIATVAYQLETANQLFVRAVGDVFEEYFTVLERHGIRRETHGLTIDRSSPSGSR
jgi:hypothetical protein